MIDDTNEPSTIQTRNNIRIKPEFESPCKFGRGCKNLKKHINGEASYCPFATREEHGLQPHSKYFENTLLEDICFMHDLKSRNNELNKLRRQRANVIADLIRISAEIEAEEQRVMDERRNREHKK